MTAQTPIVNAGLSYVNGLQLSKTGNKTLGLTAGAARDSQNVNDIILSGIFNINQLSINGANVGANGCDQAALAISSNYYVFIIGDSTAHNPTAGLLSLSQFTPILPFGYDMFRRIGYIRTDGSANILSFYQSQCTAERTTFYDVAPNVLTAGVATAFTLLSLTGPLPQSSLSGLVWLDISYTPASATNLAQFLPGGSLATNGIVRFGTGVAGAQVGQVCVPYRTIGGTPQILYKVSNAGDSLTVNVAGYSESLFI